MKVKSIGDMFWASKCHERFIRVIDKYLVNYCYICQYFLLDTALCEVFLYCNVSVRHCVLQEEAVSMTMTVKRPLNQVVILLM